MKYLIIGGCIAACGAVEGIRSKDTEGEIIIIDGEKRGAYTRPLISYYLAEPEKYADISYRPPEFFDKHKVNVIGARAEKVDRSSQQVMLDNGETFHYDRLLLATGAVPITAPIPGADQDWVKSFYTLGAVQQINKDIQVGQEAVIIGTGLIGMKAAEALYKRGLAVHMIEKEKHILPRQLSKSTAVFMNHFLRKQGIDIITGDEVTVVHPQHVVELKSGKMLPADLLIMAVGTRPEVKLAVESGLEVRQGIVVDNNLRTSDDKIYAAGDAAETFNVISGQAEVMALLPHAHREGYLAGCNMAGKECLDKGSTAMNSVKLMGWNICSAGQSGDNQGELLAWYDKDKMLELKINGDYLIGYIAINMPETAGPLTNAVEKKIPAAAGSWQGFIDQGPSLAAIPQEYWQEIRRIEEDGSNQCS